MIELFGNIWRLEYPSLLVFDGPLEQAYASLSLPDKEGWTEVEDLSEMKIHKVLELNSKLTDVYGLKIDISKLDKRGITLISGLPKMYCTCCGEGHDPKDIGIVYGSHHCVGCADEMGEPLQNRGVH